MVGNDISDLVSSFHVKKTVKRIFKYYYSLHQTLESILPRLYGLVFRYKKFVKYVISGSIAAVASIATAFVMTDILGLWYLASTITGFISGVITSFLFQKFWTFENRSVQKIKTQFLLYFVVVLAALLLNTFFVYVFVEYAKLWYIFAQILAGIPVIGFNLFFYQRIVFKPVVGQISHGVGQ